jgi:hypothetical protein
MAPVTQVGSDTKEKINLQEELPRLSVEGQSVFEGRYRGIERNYIPNIEDPNDSRYEYWNNIENIKVGFELLKTISELNPNRQSLYTEFLFHNNFSRINLFKSIMNDRTDLKDIWFYDFDTSIDAIFLLGEIMMDNLTLSEIDEILDNEFELYDYYNEIIKGTIDINGTVIPTWKKVTLKDLFNYRLNNYLASENVLLTGVNYNNLGVAVERGIVELSDIGSKKLNFGMFNNKDAEEYTTTITTDLKENHTFFNPYYSQLLQGNSNENLKTTIPLLSEIMDELNNYNGMTAPIQIEIKIDSLPNQLLQKKYDNF